MTTTRWKVADSRVAARHPDLIHAPRSFELIVFAAARLARKQASGRWREPIEEVVIDVDEDRPSSVCAPR